MTLEGLKNSIHVINLTPALKNDGAVLNVLNNSKKYSPQNDQDLREILQLFMAKSSFKFTVVIDTIKSFLRLDVSKSVSALRF